MIRYMTEVIMKDFGIGGCTICFEWDIGYMNHDCMLLIWEKAMGLTK